MLSPQAWSLALGGGGGLSAGYGHGALHCLAEQLGLTFRALLSFWTAGELADERSPQMRERSPEPCFPDLTDGPDRSFCLPIRRSETYSSATLGARRVLTEANPAGG
jgi:hypothetical protein